MAAIIFARISVIARLGGAALGVDADQADKNAEIDDAFDPNAYWLHKTSVVVGQTQHRCHRRAALE